MLCLLRPTDSKISVKIGSLAWCFLCHPRLLTVWFLYTVDPFVDDSDEIAQVSAELRKRKLKTVHGGFFVSAGELEVEKGPEKRKKRQAAEIGRNAKPTVSLPVAAQATAPLVPSAQENDTNAGGLQQTPLPTPVGAVTEQTSGATPRVRIAKPKPLWTPCPATLSAIDAFRVAVQELKATLSKTGFLPQQVRVWE